MHPFLPILLMSHADAVWQSGDQSPPGIIYIQLIGHGSRPAESKIPRIEVHTHTLSALLFKGAQRESALWSAGGSLQDCPWERGDCRGTGGLGVVPQWGDKGERTRIRVWSDKLKHTHFLEGSVVSGRGWQTFASLVLMQDTRPRLNHSEGSATNYKGPSMSCETVCFSTVQ